MLYMQTQTLNISLPKEVVTQMDRLAKREYRNRSEYIKELIKQDMADQSDWDEIFAYGRAAAKKLGIKSEEDVNRMVQEYRHGKNKD